MIEDILVQNASIAEEIKKINEKINFISERDG